MSELNDSILHYGNIFRLLFFFLIEWHKVVIL